MTSVSAAKSLLTPSKSNSRSVSPTSRHVQQKNSYSSKKNRGRSLSPSYMQPTLSSSSPTERSPPTTSTFIDTYLQKETPRIDKKSLIDNAVRLAKLRVKEHNLKARSLSQDKSKDSDFNEHDPYDPLTPPPQPYQRDVKRNYMSSTVVLPKPKPLSPQSSPSPPKVKGRKNVKTPSVYDEKIDFDDFHYDIDDKNEMDVQQFEEFPHEEEIRGRSLHREKKMKPKAGHHNHSRASATPRNKKSSPIRKQDSISPETYRNHRTLSKAVGEERQQLHQPSYDVNILNTRTRSRHDSFSFDDSPATKDRRLSIDETTMPTTTQAVPQRHASPPKTITSVSKDSVHDFSIMSQKKSPVRDHLLTPAQRQRRRLHASSTDSATPIRDNLRKQKPAVESSTNVSHASSHDKGTIESGGTRSRRSHSSHGTHSQRASVASRSNSVGSSARLSNNKYVHSDNDGRRMNGSTENIHNVHPSRINGPENDDTSDDAMHQLSETDGPETNEPRRRLDNENRRSHQQRKSNGSTNGYGTDGECSRSSRSTAASYHQSNNSIYDIIQGEYKSRREKIMKSTEELSIECRVDPDQLNGMSDAYISPYSQGLTRRRESGGSNATPARNGRILHPYTRSQNERTERANRFNAINNNKHYQENERQCRYKT